MQSQFFNNNATYLALGFLLVYVAAQLLVSKHPRFQAFTPIQKSVAVKVLALVSFIVLYALSQVFDR